MRWSTPLVTTLLACILLAAPAGSQAPAGDREVLDRVARTYRGLKRFIFKGTIEVELRRATNPMSQKAPFFVAVDGKGRIRDEVTDGPAGGMIVSDGKHTWIYNRTLGQYTRQAGNSDSAFARMVNKGVGGTLTSRFAEAATGVTAIKRLPNETLQFDGAKRNLIVLDVSYAPTPAQARFTEEPRRYWIDPKTHMVVRMRTRIKADSPQFGGKVEQEETVSFQRAAADPVFPESLWVFRAPPESKEVAAFSSERDNLAASFTGKPAIDFSLRDLMGREHSLKGLRGKTVLLDFWASWCGPCRITMPQVAKIHAEYKDRGVEVMSINVGESVKKANDYMTKNNYTFTALVDEDRTVSDQYKIGGIPTLIVIDRTGTVSDYLVGARDDVALRAALKKAGVQ